MKKNKGFGLIGILIILGGGAYYVGKSSKAPTQNPPANNYQPVTQNDTKTVVRTDSKTKNDDTCPTLTSQQASTVDGKPLPGKYQFILDFKQDGFKCIGKSWGGDFPGCDKSIPITTIPWYKGDVVNSCFALYEDEGSDTGWGIGLENGSNTRVPLRYVKKVSDTTPITK